MKPIEIKSGKRFGRLVVIKQNGRTKQGEKMYECRCDCGNLHSVRGWPLRAGVTKSCGCYARDFQRKHGAAVGGKTTPEYRAWTSLKNRCTNRKSKLWKHYGGRGITVCERWLGDDGFANFLADMGVKPTKELSIDRIDNDGNYTPDNCRWATKQEQSKNKRYWNARQITINGVTHHVAEWARIMGIPYSTLANRLRAGWDETEAVTKPVNGLWMRIIGNSAFIDIKSPHKKRVEMTKNEVYRIKPFKYSGVIIDIESS